MPFTRIGVSTHAQLSSVGINDHHAAVHIIPTHGDTSATGAELNTLTDGSDAEGIHIHGILTDLGTERLNASVAVSGNVVASNTIQSASNVDRLYIYSAFTSTTGEKLNVGTSVNAAEAVNAQCHTLVTRTEAENDVFETINGSATALTVEVQVVELTQ